MERTYTVCIPVQMTVTAHTEEEALNKGIDQLSKYLNENMIVWLIQKKKSVAKVNEVY